MDRGLLLLILLVVVGIPGFACQNEYKTCRQPFACGSITNLSYPFYGGDRPAYCGYPGFHLSCQDDSVALINTSSITYRLLSFDNQAQTVTVARNDLWTSPCTRLLINTTVDSALYNFDYSANDQQITLVYGCTAQITPSPYMPNQFNCSENGIINGEGFFLDLPETGFTCAGPQITVRITQTAAAALALTPSIALLQTSLQTGFSVQLSADNHNCQNCVRSGGTCGSDQSSGSFACYYINGSGKGIPKKYAIIGVLLSVPIIVLSVYCLVHFLVKKNNSNVEKFLVTHRSVAQKRYSYYEIKKMTKSFQDKLGQGGFGSVYKGELPDGQPVAVKVLTQTRDDDDDNAEEFINEVASISRASHANIVNLLGFCYHRNKRALVYEFMSNKSLDKFIYNAECSLEWNKLYEVAVGVARGLEYLHRGGCHMRIVHFDIKPHNILLDGEFRPKISDFGLAKLFKMKQNIISLGMRGTIGYIAPEVFSRNFGVVSHKSDVYSYGMMLLEMAEARKMVETEPTQSSENYFPDNIYELVLLKNEKMVSLQIRDEKEESEIKMLMVGVWCIQTDPSDRPSMSKVLEMLEGSLQSIQIPPKPFFPLQSRSVEFSSSMNMDTQNSTYG